MKTKTVKFISLLSSLLLFCGTLSSCAIIDIIEGDYRTGSSSSASKFPSYTPGYSSGGSSNSTFPGYTPGANTPAGTTSANTQLPETTVPANGQEPSSTPSTSTPVTPTTPSSAVKTLTEITSTGSIPYKYFVTPSHITDTNLFPYFYSSKYGYADERGNIVIPEQFESARNFSEGKAFVKLNGIWNIIDTKGNVLYTLTADYNKSNASIGSFENGRAICSTPSSDYQNKIYLIINEDFSTNTITCPKSTGLKIINSPEFFGGLEYYTDKNDNTKTIVNLKNFNTNSTIWSGIWTTDNYDDFEYAKILSQPAIFGTMIDRITVKNGYINLFNNDLKWGLVDIRTGEAVIDFKYEYVGSYSDGLCNVCSYGKWGYVDLNGNKPVEFNFLYTDAFVNGTALVVTSDSSFCMVDTTGNIKYNCGCKLVKVPRSTCRFDIYTALQKNGIIIIHDLFGDIYHIVCVGGKTTTTDEKESVLASYNYIFADGTMFSY